MVPGKLAETNSRKGFIKGGYDVFSIRLVSLILLLLAILSFGVPVYQTYKANKKEKAGT